MKDGDTLRRFTLEGVGVRGELVYLDASWRAVLDIHPYPEPVRQQLGEALAAVVLLAATIKFDGSLILQANGTGALKTLVAQATHHGTVRGLARWDGDVPEGALSGVFGDGQLALTVDPTRGERYQGIVPLQGADLAEAIEHYFSASEQLPTRLWLASTERRAAGLLLQRMPTEWGQDEDWERVTMLAETISDEELLGLAADRLLFRLFNEETIRLFEPEPIAFRCSCSLERVQDTLKALGRDEIESILQEQGDVQIDCEFCNRHYRFDAVDIGELFADAVPNATPSARH